jgi:GntR family transcriptional regulator, transcriptional repressor for pyruvate dehydrogenase complex
MSPSISDDITQRLMREILRGEIAAGDKLPPERELAVRFKTNRNTLREALRNLATMNLIAARQGDGLRVQDFRETGEWTLVPSLIQVEGGTVDERIQILEDILRLRRVLIGDVVRSVAKQGTEEEILAMRALVELQRSHFGEAGPMVETDLELLLALVAASRSLAFKWIFNTVARMYRQIVFVHPGLLYFSDDYCETYDAILDACAAHDPSKAAEIMGTHLEESDEAIFQAIHALRVLAEEI